MLIFLLQISDALGIDSNAVEDFVLGDERVRYLYKNLFIKKKFM